MSDFFEREDGFAHTTGRRTALLDDLILDFRLRIDPRLRRLRKEGAHLPRQNILVVGVDVPSRGGALGAITAKLARSRHRVDVSTVEMQPMGKFQNVDRAIDASPNPLASYDWLVVVDDDVALPSNFLDDYIAIATEARLILSQPAHRFRSFTTYDINQRRYGAIARLTGFVETGPLTVFHSTAFERLIPFPVSRWSYGIDIVWAGIAAREGWRMGVIDALPVGHTRPIGGTYDSAEAVEEGRAMLKRYGITRSRDQLLRDYGILF